MVLNTYVFLTNVSLPALFNLANDIVNAVWLVFYSICHGRIIRNISSYCIKDQCINLLLHHVCLNAKSAKPPKARSGFRFPFFSTLNGVRVLGAVVVGGLDGKGRLPPNVEADLEMLESESVIGEQRLGELKCEIAALPATATETI